MSRRARLAALGAAALVVTLVVAVAVGLLVSRAGDDGGASRRPASPAPSGLTAGQFLHRYVTPQGRVVRRDQGGDTVSEGQAYAMLIAVGSGDSGRFDAVWRWTRDHLQRPDGLLSWRWDHGHVADPQPAADADLDAARALVLAARRFHRPDYRRDATAMGRAVLTRETARTPQGLVLLPGPWATSAPHYFDPSYVSPVAMRLLGQATGDPRWQRLRRGSAAAVRALTDTGRLPPDWATISAAGKVSASGGPSRGQVQYGYDAARTAVWFAESCAGRDRRVAAQVASVLGARSPVVAVHSLDGAPRTQDVSPVGTVGHAAGLAAAGRWSAADRALASTFSAQHRQPGYYGDAWTVLGPMLLRHPDLGGCPPLKEHR